MWFLILLGIMYLAVNFFLWHRVLRLLRHVHCFFAEKEGVCVFTVIYLFFLNS